MLSAFKIVLFPVHDRLLTTSTDEPSLAGTRTVTKVSGHQYRWLAGGYDLETGRFLEVASMVLTWYILAFLCSDSAVGRANKFMLETNLSYLCKQCLLKSNIVPTNNMPEVIWQTLLWVIVPCRTMEERHRRTHLYAKASNIYTSCA